MPHTNRPTNPIRSDGEDSDSDGDNFNSSHPSTIGDIISFYHGDWPDAMDSGDVYKKRDLLTKWFEWSNRQYPGISWNRWPEIATAASEDVDIRLLIRGQSHVGYSILLFLEACYAVDKAFCGTDVEAFAKVKRWHIPQEMKAYKYLLSEEMILWWVTELGELENEIKSPSLNLVSLSWRIADLKRCLAKLNVAMECGHGIATNIWTTLEETDQDGPPGGLKDAIFVREKQLSSSIKILSKALERRKQGDVISDITTLDHKSVESGGIRKRVPRAASPSGNEHDSGAVSITNEENVTPTSNVTSSTQADSPLSAAPSMSSLQHLHSVLEFVTRHFKKSIIRYKVKGLLTWFADKETAIILSLCFIIISVFFCAWSIILTNSQSTSITSPTSTPTPTSDPNFLGNLSQSILSNLSIYLIIATTIHDHSAGLRYQSWFWLCLGLSSLSSVLGLSLYYMVPVVSMVFLWIAAFAQVVIPILLIARTGKAEAELSKHKNDVEHHSHWH